MGTVIQWWIAAGWVARIHAVFMVAAIGAFICGTAVGWTGPIAIIAGTVVAASALWSAFALLRHWQESQ
jgi:hypothetical protein